MFIFLGPSGGGTHGSIQACPRSSISLFAWDHKHLDHAFDLRFIPFPSPSLPLPFHDFHITDLKCVPMTKQLSEGTLQWGNTFAISTMPCQHCVCWPEIFCLSVLKNIQNQGPNAKASCLEVAFHDEMMKWGLEEPMCRTPSLNRLAFCPLVWKEDFLPFSTMAPIQISLYSFFCLFIAVDAKICVCYTWLPFWFIESYPHPPYMTAP